MQSGESHNLTNFDFTRENAFIRIGKRKYKQFLSLKANKPARSLVLFLEGEYITFHGGIQLTVIAGQVEAFGGLLTPSHRPAVILAPYSHHAVCMRALGSMGDGEFSQSTSAFSHANSSETSNNNNSSDTQEKSSPLLALREKIVNLLSAISTSQCVAIVLIESLDWNQKSESELNLYFPPKRIVEVMKTNDFYGHEEFESSHSEDEEGGTQQKANAGIESSKSNLLEEMAIDNSSTLPGSQLSQSNGLLSASSSQLPLSRSDSGILFTDDNTTATLTNGEQQQSTVVETDDLEYFNQLGIPGLHVLSAAVNSHYQTVVLGNRFLRLSKFMKRIVTFGPKGCGKSTSNKALVNRLLRMHSHVLYLESDLGQPEFTPPGMLSLSLLDAPQFGPAFSHLGWPLLSYNLGTTNAGAHSEQYCILIKRLLDFARSNFDDSIPIILNTMGWVKEFGLHLMAKIVSLFDPTHIIQIGARKVDGQQLEAVKGESDLTQILMQQYPSHSAPSNLNMFSPPQQLRRCVNCAKWTYEDETVLDREAHTNATEGNSSVYYHYLPQEDFKAPLIPLHAKQLRELRLIAYFQVTPSRSLGAGLTYRVPWRAIRLAFPNHFVSPSKALYALNCSIVALVCDHTQYDAHMSQPDGIDRSGEFPMFNMSQDIFELPIHGYGIVKSIDSKEKTYSLITPLPLSELQHVNTFVHTNIELPVALLLRGVTPSTPYLQHDTVTYMRTRQINS